MLQSRNSNGVVPILMYPEQIAFVTAPETTKGFCAGRGAGKTKAGAIDILWNAKDGEPFMAVAPDFTVMSESTYPTFLETANEFGKLIRKKESPFPTCWFRTRDNGVANITFRSSDDPQRLRGPSKAGIWLDEAGLMPRDVYDVVLPALRYRMRMGQIRLTFTPRGRLHWTFKLFYEECRAEDEGIWICNSKYRLKPNKHLTLASSRINPFLAKEYADIVGSELTSDLRRQEIEGEFVDFSGLLFSRADFRFMSASEVPRNCLRVRYWDIAGTEGDGCWTVGTLMAKTMDSRYIVEDVERGQWTPAQRYKKMLSVAQADAIKYGGEVVIWVEREGAASGKEVAEEHVRQLAGYPVYIDKPIASKFKTIGGEKHPGRGKTQRAIPFAGQVERHNVYLVKAPWNDDYIDELVAFGTIPICDQADSSSGAYSKLTAVSIDQLAASRMRIDGESSLGSRVMAIQESMMRSRGN